MSAGLKFTIVAYEDLVYGVTRRVDPARTLERGSRCQPICGLACPIYFGRDGRDNQSLHKLTVMFWALKSGG